MKKITYSLAIAATILATANTYAQHGIGTNTPHRSAALEVKSTNKGLLIPRVTLGALTGQGSGLNASVENAESLMVYHIGGNTIPAGYYYWNGNSWIPFATGNSVAALNGQNAITRNGNFFELGGELNRNTNITLNGQNLTFDFTAENSKFFLKGLGEISAPTLNAAPNMDLVVYSNQTDQVGQVFRYGPNQLFKAYLKGVNGIQVTNNDLENQTEVSLGGPLTKHTLINTDGYNLVIKTGSESDATPGIRMEGTGLYVDNIQGWHQIPNNTNDNMVIAVGHMESKQMSAATPKQVVDAGLTVEQTAIVNNSQTLTINDTQLVTDYNNLVLTGDVTGTISGNVVTKIQSIPVSETDPANGELLGYDGTAWTPVAPSSIVAAGISADNGLTLATGNVVQLGGTLLKPTVITTNTTTEGGATMNTLAIAGLQNANVGAHKNVTVDETGVLRTTDRIATAAGANAEQVVLSVALTGNQNLALTTASEEVLGQVVNVMITSSDETGTLYITGAGTHLTGLSDLGYTDVPENVLAIGGLKDQKFTFKCVAKGNSYVWEVVSRN